MTKRYPALALLILAIGSPAGWAADAAPQTLAMSRIESPDPQADRIAADIAATAQPDAVDPGLRIEELIETFESTGTGLSFRTRAERGEMFYVTASATVMAKPESRDWGNARIMAYKEALLKAQAQYVESLGVTVTSDSLSRLFDDRSQMPHFSAEDLRSRTKLGELLDKAVAVAGGMLDEKLTELGIDPDEFKAAPAEKRAVLFERSVTESTHSRARHSLSGVIPVKTFEAYNANGDHVVAVAIVASERFRAFVEDIVRSRGDIAPVPDKAGQASLVERLRGDKLALLDEFGIRRLYDEDGYPVLVSFGQSSNPYRGPDFQLRADNRELSYAAAKADAFANFAYLFKSTAESEQTSSRTMQNRRTGIARAEGTEVTETEESSREFIQAIDREISARGEVKNLAGTRELFRWTAAHPMYGHEINGVVYVWHPVLERTARQLRDGRPARQAADAGLPATPVTGSAGSRQSRDLMSADDF